MHRRTIRRGGSEFPSPEPLGTSPRVSALTAAARLVVERLCEEVWESAFEAVYRLDFPNGIRYSCELPQGLPAGQGVCSLTIE
jgi:hypothetical protein